VTFNFVQFKLFSWFTVNHTFFVVALLLWYCHATDKTSLSSWGMGFYYFYSCLPEGKCHYLALGIVSWRWMLMRRPFIFVLLCNLLNTLSFSLWITVHCHCHEWCKYTVSASWWFKGIVHPKIKTPSLFIH